MPTEREKVWIEWGAALVKLEKAAVTVENAKGNLEEWTEALAQWRKDMVEEQKAADQWVRLT